MRVVQTYRRRGKLVTRVYTRKPGRPVGSKGGYNLTPEGLKGKQRACRKLLAKLRAEGRVGSGSFKGQSLSAEHKRKVSAGVKKAIAEGRFDPVGNVRRFVAEGGCTNKSHGNRGKFYSKKNRKTMYYDSSWELARMQTLEKDNDVVYYQREPLRIPYKFNGSRHYYHPDFLVTYRNGDQVLEEVKPKPLCRSYVNQAKFRAARLSCAQRGFWFSVITTRLMLEAMR